jgi:hypothetical protein
MRIQGCAVMAGVLLVAGCAGTDVPVTEESPMEERLGRYTTVRLTADMGQLSERDRRVVGLLIEAADEMNGIFWEQAYGDADSLLAGITDEAAGQYAMINYGPWDRLDDNRPFIEGVRPKPAGANFYPADMTKEEFEAAAAGAAGRSCGASTRWCGAHADGDASGSAVPRGVRGGDVSVSRRSCGKRPATRTSRC